MPVTCELASKWQTGKQFGWRAKPLPGVTYFYIMASSVSFAVSKQHCLCKSYKRPVIRVVHGNSSMARSSKQTMAMTFSSPSQCHGWTRVTVLPPTYRRRESESLASRPCRSYSRPTWSGLMPTETPLEHSSTRSFCVSPFRRCSALLYSDEQSKSK